MALNHAQLEVARRLAHEIPNIDSSLPIWAKRSNPLIKRQLGGNWRVFPPEFGSILKWYLVQTTILLLTILTDMVYLYLMTLLFVSILLFPNILYIYGRVLITILTGAAHSMAAEYENDTLTVLRSTPLSLREIILSKISGTIWQHMDDMTLTIFYTLVFGTPMIALYYLLEYPPLEQPVISQFMSIIMLAACVIRLPLEMFMVGALGVMMGSAARIKSSAMLGTIVLCGFYFLLLNLARLIPMPWYGQLFVDVILPVTLPLIISWGAVRSTEYLITRE